MTLRTVLLSLQALLAAAEPDDPQDAVVAKQYKENRSVFEQTAKHWTNVYAGGGDQNFNIKHTIDIDRCRSGVWPWPQGSCSDPWN